MKYENRIFEMFSEFVPLLQSLIDKDDRTIAVVGAAYLDELLKAVLEKALCVDDKRAENLLGEYRPLADFAVRTELAYAMGLLNSKAYDDLNLMRKIRNRFAHQYGDMTLEMLPEKWSYSRLHGFKAVDKGNTPDPTDRARFLVSFILLVEHLCDLGVHAVRPVENSHWTTETNTAKLGEQWFFNVILMRMAEIQSTSDESE